MLRLLDLPGDALPGAGAPGCQHQAGEQDADMRDAFCFLDQWVCDKVDRKYAGHKQ